MRKWIFALMILAPTVCHAGDWDMQLGYTNRQNYTVQWDDALSTGNGWHAQVNFGLAFGYGKQDPTLERGNMRLYPEYTGHHYLFAGMTALYVHDAFYFGIGGVELNAQTPHLTSKYQFIDTIGLHMGKLHIEVRHLSNGHTGGSNGGETALMIGSDF